MLHDRDAIDQVREEPLHAGGSGVADDAFCASVRSRMAHKQQRPARAATATGAGPPSDRDGASGPNESSESKRARGPARPTAAQQEQARKVRAQSEHVNNKQAIKQ
eukprot:2400468-Pyramimonas_sp.AAC.2